MVAYAYGLARVRNGRRVLDVRQRGMVRQALRRHHAQQRPAGDRDEVEGKAQVQRQGHSEDGKSRGWTIS